MQLYISHTSPYGRLCLIRAYLLGRHDMQLILPTLGKTRPNWPRKIRSASCPCSSPMRAKRFTTAC